MGGLFRKWHPVKETVMPVPSPMLQLCPGCCTLDEILELEIDPKSLAPLVGCMRCSFTFPLLPGESANVTMQAMRRHDCRVSKNPEDWAGVAEAITAHIHELGLNQCQLAERSHAIWMLSPDKTD
jgi:hypothetical protein